MTTHTSTSRKKTATLREMLRFYRAQQLASGDNLAERVAQLKDEVAPSAYALAVWKLGRDCRRLLNRYADDVEYSDRFQELAGEFDAFQRVLNDISQICEEHGLEELTRLLQAELVAKAEQGAFLNGTPDYIQASVTNPALYIWGDELATITIIDRVIPRLSWPSGFVPRRLELAWARTGAYFKNVNVMVRVGEKIQG